ncbi:DUF397 domain-containing protein [Streptomyces sp. DSM 42041]|uniref:DUF397 domain-containing protein n=1 Tax=Streptomyces hazeniae TaxID=3075538 RepID=A0ABU2NYQ7_9ACTN|nr:DUF397 domain-containing protein [Streptomyces sp. DSM 42041]MDT0382126.1 DUF397 domain-containing protein [Streptomyces sp. DSM 42041]
MNTDSAWFRSSYSGPEGGNCVEVAFAWRKSSYSGSDGGNCVEVADAPDAIRVRDSKVGVRGPQVAVKALAWASFVEFAAKQG